MNDDSHYYPNQHNAENAGHPDAEPFAHRFPDADAESASEVSTPFAPEDAPEDAPDDAPQDAPVHTRQNPLTRQYQPDSSRLDSYSRDSRGDRDTEASAAYAFGVTDAAEGEELRRQAQTDAALAAEIEEFRALHRAMHFAAPPVTPPPGLGVRLRAATQPEDPARAASSVRRSAPAPIFTVPQPTLVRPATASARNATPPSSANRVNPLTGRPIARSAPVTPVAPVPATSRFATKPAGAAQKATQALVPDSPRTGIFAANTRVAWSGALVALLLFAGATYLWFDQAQMNNRTLTQTASLQTRSEELESNLANAQQDLLESRQAYDDAQATLSQSQALLATAQVELATAQTNLTGSQEQLTEVQTRLSEQLDLQTTLVTLLAQAQMQTASLAATNAISGTADTTPAARIVWEPETNAGMLVTMEMPPLAADQVYQLWYLRSGVPYSAGMFTVDASGKGMLELDSMAIADFDVAAITPEPMGGSPAPTGPILIVGEL